MESLPTKEASSCTVLLVQLLRIRLPVQGTQVRSLVWEDSTCRGATKPNTLISQALDPLHTLGPQPCKHLLAPSRHEKLWLVLQALGQATSLL